MTTAELVKALRNCSKPISSCNGCQYDGKEWEFGCDSQLMVDAAYALEAADKRIAELEAQAEALKEESEAYKFGYLDGKTESDRQIEDLQTALTACRLRKGEARLPKEGEWKVEEMTEPDGLIWCRWYCSHCGEVVTKGWRETKDGRKPKYNYCPNCGAKMGKEKEDGET